MHYSEGESRKMEALKKSRVLQAFLSGTRGENFQRITNPLEVKFDQALGKKWKAVAVASTAALGISLGLIRVKSENIEIIQEIIPTLIYAGYELETLEDCDFFTKDLIVRLLKDGFIARDAALKKPVAVTKFIQGIIRTGVLIRVAVDQKPSSGKASDPFADFIKGLDDLDSL